MKKINTLSLLLTSSFVLLAGTKIADAANLTSLNLTSIQPKNPVLIVQQSDPRFTNSNGTVKEGTALSIDPDQINNVPNNLRNKLFILNKIYRVQEGAFYDDLFIVDEGGKKWQVGQVDSKNLVYLESGEMNVWALIQQF